MGVAFCLLSFMFPPLGLVLGFVGLASDMKNWRRYIFCLAIFLAGFAYAFVPLGGSDLTRYRDAFELFGKKSFWEAVTYNGPNGAGYGEGLFVLHAIYWVLGKLSDYHLAPALTTFVIYYIGYYVTCKIGNDMKASKKQIILYIVFITFTLNYFAIINNIRNIFAFSLVGCAIFRDCYLKKRNIWTILLYIMPIFVHSSAIILVLVRFVLFLPRRAMPVISIVLLFAGLILNVLHENLSIFGAGNAISNVFRLAIIKGYYFFNDTSSEWGQIVQSSSSQKLARIVYIAIAFIFVLHMLTQFHKQKKKNALRLDSNHGFLAVCDFSYFAGLFAIACLPMLMPEYWRFASAMILFGGTMYFYILQKTKERSIGRVSLYCIYFLMPVATALWVREFLSQSNVFDLVIQAFISSPVFVVLRNLFNVFI